MHFSPRGTKRNGNHFSTESAFPAQEACAVLGTMQITGRYNLSGALGLAMPPSAYYLTLTKM